LVQPDGKIVVGGQFNSLGGQGRTYLGRLNADSSLDTGFVPSPNSYVHALALQCDGSLLVGGEFTTVKALSHAYVVRLTPDGSVDNSFGASANARVYGLTVQPDGKIWAGGAFTTLAGAARSYLGRMTNSMPAIDVLDAAGGNARWMRGATAPEMSRVTFESSINGTDWVPMAGVVRSGHTWQVPIAVSTSGQIIRARGYVNSGRFLSSVWYVEKSITVAATALTIITSASNFGFTVDGFGFPLQAPSGSTFIVDTTSDFVQWTPIATNSIDATNYFTDVAPNGPSRFYRLRSP
jgi:uncharacterized delta-60 repeat protein